MGIFLYPFEGKNLCCYLQPIKCELFIYDIFLYGWGLQSLQMCNERRKPVQTLDYTEDEKSKIFTIFFADAHENLL